MSAAGRPSVPTRHTAAASAPWNPSGHDDGRSYPARPVQRPGYTPAPGGEQPGAYGDPWTPGGGIPQQQNPYEGAPRGEQGRRARSPGGAPPPRSRRHAEAHTSEPASQGRINEDIDLDEVDPKGRARRAAAREAERRTRPVTPARKALRYAAMSMAAVMLAVVGFGAYIYAHFNGNIKSTALLPAGATQAAEIPNKFGQTAMNILLLGNGGRINAADCKLGGACSDTTTDADTLMVVHLAADRSNMTVMSIPRDTIVNLPACAHDNQDLINASLNNGPACAVQTVHDVTGLTIDHFVEVDMSGVVTMSNALGGVPVCVTNNLYDSYSHLKLPKGTSVLQGTQALAWLRTRHAFINEVYREQAQHMFMSALLRKLEQSASLTHVSTLYNVADAATKALTVDSGLGSITDLLSLAQEIGKVPTSQVTMLSAPTVAYSGSNSAWSQQLQLDPTAAPYMFNALKTDTSYTAPTAKAKKTSNTASAAASSSPSAAPSSASASNVDKALVNVAVENGSGTNGRAGALKTALAGAGFSSSRIATSTASTTSATALYYPSTRADSAAAVAAALGIPSSAMHESSSYSEVTVVIGGDWTSGTTYGSGGNGTASTATTASAAPTAVASSAPASSLQTNASDTKACMYVPQPEW